jgi:CHAT domain-containing protein
MFPFKPLALVVVTLTLLPVFSISAPVPAIAQATQDPTEANRLFNQGIQQYQTNQFEAAIQSWQQALARFRQLKDRQGEAATLGNLGVAYSSLGNYGKTIELQQQRLVIARKINDRRGEGQALGSLGMAHQSLGNYAKAIELQQQRLVIVREINDQRGEGQALSNLGNAYDSLGDYAKAIELYQQSLAIARKIQNRGGEAAALGNLGIAYYSLGNYAKAIEFQQQYLAISRELNDRLGEGQALGNLGNAYRALGNYAKAIEFQEQSLAIARELKDRRGESAALGTLGVAYDSLGNYAKAIEFHQQNLAISREIKDRQGESTALGNLGIAYYSLANYAKAIEFYQQSLLITRALKDRRGEGNALGNLGSAYNALGNYAKAIEYHQQSLALSQAIKDRRGEGTTLGNLGNAQQSLGNYAKAIEYHQQHLAIAREIKDRWGEGAALGNLGVAYNSLSNYAKAIEFYQQRLTIAREIKDRLGEGQSLNNLGLTLLATKDWVKAEKALFQGIEIWESLRFQLGNNDTNKVSIFEEQARTYRALQQVLIAANKPEQALEIAERGRSRAFVELLTKRLQKTGTVQDTIAPPNLQQIRQIAKAQKATLVQYSTIRDEFLYIWVIKPTGEITFRQVDLKATLPKGTSLEEYVRTLRSDSLGVRGLGVVAKPNVPAQSKTNQLQDLHRLLIDPIASLLPQNPNDRVIFIPQGALFLVPFAALQTPDGKYLIERHTLLTAPSIQVLELTRQKQLARTKVTGKLIVGNPTMPSFALTPDEAPEQLPELPGAEAEAKAIAQFLNAPVLTGSQATKAIVKQQMGTARLIHLATHGLLDDQRGIGSAIALAPSGTDNGFLTAEEILDLKLNADLVVLSACDTGRGKITGDGVIGLSRSLISAGAPSVIVSLWAVPDAPTSALMTQFYRHLQQNPDKAQALRQAMLTTLKQHPNPRDWAAFTLIGEAE